MTGRRAIARYGGILLGIPLTVGPISHIVHGPTGLAWGLGFGLVAGLVGTRIWGPGWGLVWGLSAGLAIGVGVGDLMGGIQGMIVGGLVWGFIGGAVGRLLWEPPWRIDRALSFIFYSGLVLPFPAAIITGVIGIYLEGFSLTGAGFLIGVFFSMAWGIGSVVGVLLGHLTRNKWASQASS